MTEALRTGRVILAATGIHNSVVPIALAVTATVVWHGGVIRAIGPLSLAAPLPVVVAAPALIAVACGISHTPPRTPVITRSVRPVAARALSHLTVLAVGVAVAWVGDVLAPGSTLGPAVRNLFLLSAAALVASALAGPAYAWMPVVVLFGMGVLSNPTPEPWSLHALLMSSTAHPGQVLAVAGVCLVAVGLAAADLRNLAYLPAPAR